MRRPGARKPMFCGPNACTAAIVDLIDRDPGTPWLLNSSLAAENADYGRHRCLRRTLVRRLRAYFSSRWVYATRGLPQRYRPTASPTKRRRRRRRRRPGAVPPEPARDAKDLTFTPARRCLSLSSCASGLSVIASCVDSATTRISASSRQAAMQASYVFVWDENDIDLERGETVV